MPVKTKKLSRKSIWSLTVIGILLVVVLVSLYVGNRYVNGGEYRRVVSQCGTKEIVYGYTNPKDPTLRYVRPADPDYSPPFPYARYFCTEQQAVSQGYKPLYNADGTYNQE